MRILHWMAFVTAALMVAACGGGGGGGGAAAAAAPASAPAASTLNVLPVVIDSGPANSVNIPFVSVKICAPGTSTCQTIDHVIVDTGSSGLRILSSVLSSALTLPQMPASGGNSLVECMQFVDGYAWGPVKAADVTLGGETAGAMAIQVIGDPAFAAVPSKCARSGISNKSTARALGGNGILGVSAFQHDCGNTCAQVASAGIYYSCVGGACLSIATGLADQVQNPVGLLPTDNNGVILDLPAVASGGAASVQGSLILGIGSQANNSLGSAAIYALDPTTGSVSTVFGGKTYTSSFVDSGSNGLFFTDPGTTVCSSGFYCPATTQQLTATLQGTKGNSTTVSFSVANADSLFSTGNTAFNNLAGAPFGATNFVWGTPFYLGRKVYTAIESKSSGGTTGPFVAF